MPTARPLHNPFTYGETVSEEAFTDREAELRELESDIRNGQNVVLIAPRRYGKSSLVRAALSRLIAEGILVVEVDLMTTPTKERFAAKLAKSIHDDLASAVFRAKERTRIFASLRITPSMTVDTEGRMTFGFSASRNPADIDATIERLLELPAEIAAEKKRRVVVYFDEFQEVTRLDPHLPGLMRAVFQTQREVCHVYAGSKRDMMHRLFNDRNEPFFRSAKTVELGEIPVPLFAEFVRAQFDRTNRGIGDAVVAKLLDVTRGHPHATQQLAYALWEEVPEGFTATDADADAALRAVLRAENARFTLLWDDATPSQKLLLEAFAREPGRPFTNAYRLAHELVRKEPDGSYDLAEPFLREWITTYAT